VGDELGDLPSKEGRMNQEAPSSPSSEGREE